MVRHVAIEEVEQEYFGVNHAIIGGWLAEYWSLPPNLCTAISMHHANDFSECKYALSSIVHIADVLSNVLELAPREKNRILRISSSACEQLGLVLDDNIFKLFGRIEASTQNVLNYQTSNV